MGPGPDEDPDELIGSGRAGEDAGESGEDLAGGGESAEDPAGGSAPGEEPGYMDRPDEIDPYPLGSEDEEDDEEDEFDSEREETGESVTIEIAGLSLYTHHGVSEAEREVGQRLVLDLRLDLGETDATVTDAIEDTVDYGDVCQLVALIAQQRSHKTLERLCGAIADRLLGDYELEGVWVKATKPEPPIALHVDEVSVEVWREAEE
jgi:7,8-dihydroneopterin aldolase/epimerase/oxygenase